MSNQNRSLMRPGGELASRPLYFFWVADNSSSMRKEKIGALNNAIQSVIPEMKSVALDNPNAQVYIRTLRFSSGASWITPEPVPIEEFVWDDLEAAGLTDMGKAFTLLSAQLSIPPMPERALPPVIVLISDGMPTDDYKGPLEKLLKMPWGKKAVTDRHFHRKGRERKCAGRVYGKPGTGLQSQQRHYAHQPHQVGFHSGRLCVFSRI